MFNLFKLLFGKHEVQQVSLQGDPNGLPKVIGNANTLTPEKKELIVSTMVDVWGPVGGNVTYSAILLSGSVVCAYTIQYHTSNNSMVINDLWIPRGTLGHIGRNLFRTNGWFDLIGAGYVDRLIINNWMGKISPRYFRNLNIEIADRTMVVYGKHTRDNADA